MDQSAAKSANGQRRGEMVGALADEIEVSKSRVAVMEM